MKGRQRNGIIKRRNSYYLRVKTQGIERTKSFGANRSAAVLALAEVKKHAAVGRATDDWSGLNTLLKKTTTKTFSDVAGDYMRERINYKKSTLNLYRDILKNFLVPEFGNLKVTQIKEDRIARFQARVHGTRSARRTNTIVQLLRSILKVCLRRKLITEDPSLGIPRVPEPQADIDPLDRHELDLALANIDSHYQPLFICLAWTGARPNELLGLRWGDIDLKRGEISIKRGRVRGHEGLPKSSSSQRVIPMSPPVKNTLQQLSDLSTANFEDHIFTDKKGKPINKHLDRIWARALKKAVLRHRPSYQLRHTFASLCLQESIDPGWLSRVLGHSTLQTTFRHYARYIKNASKDNEKKLESMSSNSVFLVGGGTKGGTTDQLRTERSA